MQKIINMNEEAFKQWLTELAYKVRYKGPIEIINLSDEEFLFLEQGLNNLMSIESSNKFDDLVRIRYLFRVIFQYHRDMELGLKALNKWI